MKQIAHVAQVLSAPVPHRSSAIVSSARDTHAIMNVTFSSVVERIRHAAHNQVVIFVALGGVSTLIQMAVYTVCRIYMSTSVSTVLSLLVSTLWNTQANQKYTFQSSETTDSHGVSSTCSHVISLAITACAACVQVYVGTVMQNITDIALLESAVVSVAGCSLGVVRFVVMKLWLFR